NEQRKIIYQRRNELMEAEDISAVIKDMRITVVNDYISNFIAPQSMDETWDIAGLELGLASEFGIKLPLGEWLQDKNLFEEPLRQRIVAAVEQDYEEKCADIGPNMRAFEKQITLQILDTFWKEHLAQMEALRQGIGLRGYGGKNPKQEYKREAFNLFEELLSNIQAEVIKFLSLVRIRKEQEVDAIEKQRAEEEARVRQQSLHAAGATASAMPGAERQSEPAAAREPVTRGAPKVGRNDPCPCGSGQKYKQCHGKLD
ncbi:MAG: SEC-C metal-binding domain-containing protein, partial [Pseudohongiellaceae bacterium]